MKLAFIVQRYGREILGGAETLARQLAERLARRHEIEVLTTTARDYITWRNECPSGEEKLRGVRIRRFPVQTGRDLEEFNRFSDWIYHNPHTREDELRWLELQGPVVPDLTECLRQEHHRYDLLVFFTYLYYPTYYGLQVAPEKSVLIPTAHDEPPLKLGIYNEVFSLPSSFIFNTESEELLVLERFGVYKKMRETVGIGMELLDIPDASAIRQRYKLLGRYLLYAGRIDAGKGCEELVRYFRFYKDERPHAGNLQLVLIGQLSMRLPQTKDIRYLGFLDEEGKLAAMAGAVAVVVPSRLESLSIVALEAFSVGTPVMVNAHSHVLVEHCRKANAGLYYSDYDEFEQILDVMLEDKNLVRGMGQQGQRYIKENFGWEKLLNKYELAFRSSARGRRPSLRPAEEPSEAVEESAKAEVPRDESARQAPRDAGAEGVGRSEPSLVQASPLEAGPPESADAGEQSEAASSESRREPSEPGVEPAQPDISADEGRVDRTEALETEAIPPPFVAAPSETGPGDERRQAPEEDETGSPAERDRREERTGRVEEQRSGSPPAEPGDRSDGTRRDGGAP